MAVLASFDEANVVLDKPAGWSYEECDPASVLRTQQEDGKPVVVSCWKLTAEELDEINRTGRVWLGVCGVTMPPSWVSGVKPF